MAKGVRYTAEEKEEMKQKALKMLQEGKKQKDAAEALGIAPMTLSNLLKGEDVPGRRRKSGGAKGIAGLSQENPVVQLAMKQQRLDAIKKEQEALSQEEEQLKSEMEKLYKQVGVSIFGAGKVPK